MNLNWKKNVRNIHLFNDIKLTPFSNGSEMEGWREHNCLNCKKFKGESVDIKKGECPLDIRIALAYINDGTIPFKTVNRIGYKEIHLQADKDNKISGFVDLSNCKEKITKYKQNEKDN